MKLAGVVAEFNPFHNGHARLLTEARERADAVAVVMSGHVTQRGDPALLDKWTRTRAALTAGADLVLELPAPWSCASAEGFAQGGVGLLRALGCTALVFGSESADPDFLRDTARALGDPGVNERIRAGVREGLPYARARQNALGFALDQPNDILAVEYLRAAGNGMEFWPIPRAGVAHDSPLTPDAPCRTSASDEGCPFDRAAPSVDGQDSGANVPANSPDGEDASDALDVPDAPDASDTQDVPSAPGAEKTSAAGLASASALRRMLLCGEDVSAFVPDGSLPPDAALCRPELLERVLLHRLRVLPPEAWSILPDANDGLAERMYRAAGEARTMEELYRLAKTKRHALARVRRVALCAALGLTGDDRCLPLPYLRVLGMGSRAGQVLACVRDRLALPLDTSLARLRRMSPAAERCAALECAATDLFACGCDEIPPRGLDFTRKPVIIKTDTNG